MSMSKMANYTDVHTLKWPITQMSIHENCQLQKCQYTNIENFVINKCLNVFKLIN